MVAGTMAQTSHKSAYRWYCDLSGAFNNHSFWEVEPSITYLPTSYAGVSLGLLFCGPLEKESLGGTSKDGKWRWFSDSDTPAHYSLALRPALRFVTPGIALNRSGDTKLSLALSPGITLPLPPNQSIHTEYFPNEPGTWVPYRTERVSGRASRTLYFQLKSALTLELEERYVLSAGYSFSDFDPYGGHRQTEVEGKRLNLPRRRHLHTLFVSLGCYF